MVILILKLGFKKIRNYIINTTKRILFLPRRILFLPKIIIQYFLNYKLGDFSKNRRLSKMPGGITFNIKRIDVRGKNVLIVVAHCDDEIIWCNTVLTSSEPASKHIFVVHDGGRTRNECIRKVAEISNSHLWHLNIPEELPPGGATANAKIREEAIKKIRQTLNDVFRKGKIDIVFTHNQFGEYGNGHHRAVHDIVKNTVSEFNSSIRVYYFGYNYASIYALGKNPWPKTLRAFSNISSWSPYSDCNFKPFSGIFKFKKYNRYWYIENNCYLPQLDEQMRKKLEECYRGVRDARVGWLRKSSLRYLPNSVEYFYEERKGENYVEYEFPRILLRPPYPVAKNKLSTIIPLKRNADIRDFLDSYLIDYLKFEGKVLWVGWDKFCVKSKYGKRILKYADEMDKLDNNPIRKDKSIYGDQVADIIANICNLKDIIKDDTYDSIYFFGVLEYVDNMRGAISECVRILKPGGRLLTGAPGYDYWITGHNRPRFEEVINMIRDAEAIPIEIWRRRNPDYYYIHAFKNG
ncbi:MAG: PIG-L family deacetylase [Elusimicrobiota bacterium]|nr:PIG-L family deacetylase [Elusimicrobiota bacterium]